MDEEKSGSVLDMASDIMIIIFLGMVIIGGARAVESLERIADAQQCEALR